MTETLISMLVVTSEALLALGTLFAYDIWRGSRRRQRTRQAAEQVVQRVRDNEGERTRSVKQALIDDCGIDAAQAQQRAESLVSREKSLIGRILRAILGRDQTVLRDLDDQMAALFASYRDVVRPAQGGANVSADAELQRQNAALEQRNQELQAQLEEASQSMEGMLREYVSMYGGDREQAQQRLAGGATPPPADDPAGSGGDAQVGGES